MTSRGFHTEAFWPLGARATVAALSLLALTACGEQDPRDHEIERLRAALAQSEDRRLAAVLLAEAAEATSQSPGYLLVVKWPQGYGPDLQQRYADLATCLEAKRTLLLDAKEAADSERALRNRQAEAAGITILMEAERAGPIASCIPG